MKIAIIGATGFIGSAILSEALARGHDVTSVTRNPGTVPTHPKLTAVRGDVNVPADLAVLLTGHEAVISAFNPGKDATGAGPRLIIEAVKMSGAGRLLVVGGAGSLESAPGKRLIDDPNFPAEWKEGALRTSAFLDSLRQETTLAWTFLSPPATIAPGERTCKFRLGGDRLLTDAEGHSRISTSDYAVAMLDEVEEPRHSRTRFTVAY